MNLVCRQIIFPCCCFGLLVFSMGCQPTHVPSSSSPSIPAAKIIEQPLSSLFPPPAPIREGSQFHLPPVQMVQVRVRPHANKNDYYRLYRQPKSWWVIHSKTPEEEWGHSMLERPFQKILRALQQLKPIETDMPVQDSPFQLSFFTHEERFLLRILQIPKEMAVSGLSPGGWLVYYHGDLYQQPRSGPLSRAVLSFQRALERLRRQPGWLPLPMNSNSFSIATAQHLGKLFAEKRKSLRRCFQKHRFPSNLGAFKMLLHFSAQGVAQKPRLLTKAHYGRKPHWCLDWCVKQWKITPPPKQEVSFVLTLPPHGP